MFRRKKNKQCMILLYALYIQIDTVLLCEQYKLRTRKNIMQSTEKQRKFLRKIYNGGTTKSRRKKSKTFLISYSNEAY